MCHEGIFAVQFIATLVVSVFDVRGEPVGSQTVIVDAGGNWMGRAVFHPPRRRRGTSGGRWAGEPRPVFYRMRPELFTASSQ